MRFEHQSLRQGLVGCWVPSLGASGLTLIDRSGFNRHGTLTNMGGQNNWRASVSGVALNFDGTDDYVECSAVSSISGSAPKTLSHWFLTTASANANWVSFGANFAGQLWQTGIFSGNVGALNFAADVTTSSTPYRDGRWHHIATMYDGASVILHLDGVRIGSGVFTINTGASAINIGRAIVASGYASVLLDDIRIYNRALTLAEIRLLASRRGIGLQPLPDRAAGLPRKLSVNVGGDWRAADAYVHDGTGFRLSDAKINVGGVWK
jgi:hypothetical protein